MTSPRAHSKGFTLIELLVVISIIGMLASVILVSVQNARASGKDSKRVSTVHQIVNALELYKSSNNHYPSASGTPIPSGYDISSTFPGGSTTCYSLWKPTVINGGTLANLDLDLSPTYLKIANTDTAPGAYCVNTTNDKYVIVFLGESNYASNYSEATACSAAGTGIGLMATGNNVSGQYPYCKGGNLDSSGGTGSGNIVTSFGFSPASIVPNGIATTNMNITLSQSANCSFSLDSETGLGGDELGLGGLSGPYNAGSFSFEMGPFNQSGSATIGVSCTGGGTGSASFTADN